MDRKVIFLVILAAAASGCTDSGGGNGIVVNELSVQPQEIRAGEFTTISLEATNRGQLEGIVNVSRFEGEITESEQRALDEGDLGESEEQNIREGAGEIQGGKILTNYCSDIFNIEEFQASSSRTGETQPFYRLDTGEKVRFSWRLNQEDQSAIPLQGYPCELRFELPFDYSVRAYKQIQIKESRDVEGSPNLASDISEGPLSIDMEIIGSTADQSNTIIKDNNASLYITAYNTDSEDSSFQGLIDISGIDINSSENIELPESCGEEGTAALASGQEEIYRCNIGYDEDFDSPSIRGEIDASINYTFVKDLGSKSVQVNYNG